MSTKWVSTKVMAEHLEVSTKTLQRWRTEGYLTGPFAQMFAESS